MNNGMSAAIDGIAIFQNLMRKTQLGSRSIRSIYELEFCMAIEGGEGFKIHSLDGTA
jgi:hypothetical protein